MRPLFEDNKSPRWVWKPALSGILGVIALMVLHLLPSVTHPYLSWAMVIVPVAALAVLARSWHARLPVTAHEIEYVRVGICFLTIAGLAGLGGGALPLTVLAGPAFWVWTVVESRRSSRSTSGEDVQDGREGHLG